MGCPSLLPHARRGQGLGLKGTAGFVPSSWSRGSEWSWDQPPESAPHRMPSLCIFPFPTERCSTSGISFWDNTHGYSVLLCPQAE